MRRMREGNSLLPKKLVQRGFFSGKVFQKNQSTLQRLNISPVDALMSLHVKDHSGSLYKGVDAFITIWRYLPYFKWLSILVSLPIVYHSACWLYSFFAKYRFARLPHCQAVLKKTKKDEGLK